MILINLIFLAGLSFLSFGQEFNLNKQRKMAWHYHLCRSILVGENQTEGVQCLARIDFLAEEFCPAVKEGRVSNLLKKDWDGFHYPVTFPLSDCKFEGEVIICMGETKWMLNTFCPRVLEFYKEKYKKPKDLEIQDLPRKIEPFDYEI